MVHIYKNESVSSFYAWCRRSSCLLLILFLCNIGKSACSNMFVKKSQFGEWTCLKMSNKIWNKSTFNNFTMRYGLPLNFIDYPKFEGYTNPFLGSICRNKITRKLICLRVKSFILNLKISKETTFFELCVSWICIS